eukprot:CAMPEP_0172301990 /NCGR_PEP_ID=MMETSP1058-20130122/3772_1 /TAXON_ID=83371 /ORGANISM="Detonula confervacea, Strain CCMP 353" /LENGTH=444 /DNA_ID=CAMNT_0013012313 /DNA_START=39 /DNA_END=1370 /DNA_ORIENTATION=-
MDEDDLEARIAAKQATKKKKKKKKKIPSTGEATGEATGDDGGGDGGEGGEGGEVVRKKKKKKRPKAPTTSGSDGADAGVGVSNSSSVLEERIRAKQSASSAEGGGEGGGAGKKKRKKKKDKSLAKLDEQIEAKSSATNDNNTNSYSNDKYGEVAAVATAAVATASMDDEEDIAAKDRSSYNDTNHGDEENGGLEMTVQHDKFNDGDDVIDLEQEGSDGNGDGGEMTASAAYYPTIIEADTEIMAEITQDGLVQVDESGGIQAFVAETIAIDGDDVGIIRSDAEIEKEEKKKYTKYFCGAVAILVVVIVAVAVPVTLIYAKGREETRITIVTDSPTHVPSGMPSLVPSSMPSSERFMEIVRKLEPLSGSALREQGTPQYLAAMWMADSDPIPNPLGGTGLDLDDDRFEQRYIAALFYYAMDGSNWKQNQEWLGEKSECFWFGIDG